jgi:hypothetical protein
VNHARQEDDANEDFGHGYLNSTSDDTGNDGFDPKVTGAGDIDQLGALTIVSNNATPKDVGVLPRCLPMTERFLHSSDLMQMQTGRD